MPFEGTQAVKKVRYNRVKVVYRVDTVPRDFAEGKVLSELIKVVWEGKLESDIDFTTPRELYGMSGGTGEMGQQYFDVQTDVPANEIESDREKFVRS